MGTKVSQEELEQFLHIRREYARITQEVGQINLAQRALKEQVTKLHVEFDQTSVREQELFSEFTTKYGVGTLNVETGEFIQETTE